MSGLSRVLADLEAKLGQEVFLGDWVEIDQSRIDAFAEATGDFQWIHVDQERAANSAFGTTIAHGFLTLSLIPYLNEPRGSSVRSYDGVRMSINYGCNRIRFPSPVPSGARLRSREELVEVEQVAGDVLQVIYKTTIEIENATKPACVAERVVRLYFE